MNNILTLSSMEVPRMPSSLATWYHTKHEEIQSNEDEVKKARLRQGLDKEFVQEIYPLVLYSRRSFPHDDVLYQVKISNQGYDANLSPVDQLGHVHTVEVTWPQDVKDHKVVAELINCHGFHGRIGDESEYYNQDILQRVPGGARHKSLNDYRSPGGSARLIVLDTICSPLKESECIAQIRSLSRQPEGLPFR
ncbi:MAG TPA: hypothetical protein VKB96_05840, partial [Gammaproteobacteria bacterium]|nr:hypothetical protein [Gammaproteobacteria bacterium]